MPIIAPSVPGFPPSDVLVVRALADLPAAVGGEILLPGKLVLLTANIDLGSAALRLSTGTILRGLASAVLTSSATGGVIRATNIGSAVILREFVVIATAGPCFTLTGTTTWQLNVFFCGFYGVSIGTVSGFDVQAFKDCFFSCLDGLTLTGTTNKVFISQCPFYAVTTGNAAVTFAAGLVARRVDMIANFFKSTPSSIPLRAIAGYSVTYGRVSQSMLDGPTTMLEGLATTNTNWWFRENDLVRNSRVAAQAAMLVLTTTTVTTLGTYVPVLGTFTLASLTQRFTLNGANELVYGGHDPVTITFNAAIAVDPTNNVRVGFRAMLNGASLSYSQTYIEQGTGASNQARPAAVVALIDLVPGDRVALAIANLTNTTGIDVLAATYAVFA